jgi:hypothetical protein
MQTQIRKDLFNAIVSRNDVYAVQNKNGTYRPVHTPFTQDVYIDGRETIGSYLLDKDNNVRCFVIDIDLNKKYVQKAAGDISEYLPIIHKQTKVINDVFRAEGLDTLIEFSGFKGYHIWGFLSEPIPSVRVRNILKNLEDKFSVIDNDKLHWEIFPKQDSLEGKGLGNLIKMPLSLHNKSGKFSYLVGENFKKYNPDSLPQIDSGAFLKIAAPKEFQAKKSEYSTRVESTSDVPNHGYPPFNLDRMERSCEQLNTMIKTAEKNKHLSHEERIWLANLLTPYGPVGKKRLHEIFSNLSDYKYDETEKNLSSLRGKPSLCSQVCSNTRCSAIQNTTWKSPIGLGYQADPSQIHPKQGRYVVSPSERDRANGRSDRVVTDWLITPTEVVDLGDKDVLKCSITSLIGTSYPEIYLENSAWHSKQKLLRALGHSELTFHGSDNDVQNLAHFVATQVPKRRKGIEFIGMYENTFVADGLNITKEKIDTDPDILVYAPGEDSLQQRVRPDLDVSDSEYKEMIAGLNEHFPNINKPGIIYPLISWLFMLPFKSRVMELYDAFPILLAYGEQGSGKTSTEEIMLELFGFQDHSVTSCRITQFAMLSLLSSTNCVPVILDEFRASDMRSHQVDFIKDRIRLAYKESLDSRGKVDLTVRNYKMRAPLVLSGEHKISEPAIMERVICGAFDSDLKSAGSAKHREHFQALKTLRLQSFLPRYVQWSLQQKIESYFAAAEKYLSTLDWYVQAPSRTRFNMAVLHCGLELWSAYGEHCGTLPYTIPLEEIFDFQKAELNLSDAGRHKRDVDILLETVSVLAEREEVKDGVEYAFYRSYYHENACRDTVLIRVKPLISALRKYKQQTGDDINVMDEYSFRTQISKAPYFLAFDKFSYKGKQQRWCVLDYEKMVERDLEVEGFLVEYQEMEDAPTKVEDVEDIAKQFAAVEYPNTGSEYTDEIPF